MARKHSRKSALHGFFDPSNKWVWAGVGAAGLTLWMFRDQLFGAGDGKTAGLGYMAPKYNVAPTLQGW